MDEVIDDGTQQQPQADEIGSLDDFAEKYATDQPGKSRGVAVEDDDEPALVARAERSPRHRPNSQRATPDDSKAIAEYTKQLRDAEESLGVKVKREEGENERVFNLRRRAAVTQAIAARAVPPAVQPQRQAPAVVSEFTEKEPTIDQFAKDPDPYSAWQRAVSAWDRRKERADEQQTEAKAGVEAGQKAAVAAKDAAYKTFGERVNTYKANVAKDYDTVVKSAENMPTPPLLETALVVDEQGPNYIYHLAKHPEIFDEIFLFTDGKVVTKETVAATQRLLKTRLQAVGTGSAAASEVVKFPPRPPNPVRTGRMRSAPAESDPTESGSLDDFASATGADSTRRRRR